MSTPASLDAQVRTRLQSWPQRPPGLLATRRDVRWVRARPGNGDGDEPPFLKLPGSTHLRTKPDGLWLGFGGTPAEPYVDVIVIEACGTMTNLLDKRSRFAPSTQSLVAVCPLPWLHGPKDVPEGSFRWQMTRILPRMPRDALVVPVRDMRIVYALKQRQYEGFRNHQVPHAHEFFVPIDALVAKNSDEDPAMQALFARASAGANFLASTSQGV